MSTKLGGIFMNKLSTNDGGAIKLKNAFLKILMTKDYSQISAKEIALEAGMNRTSFYLFFDSKSELAKNICTTFLDEYSNNFIENFDLHLNEISLQKIKEAFRYIDQQKNVIIGLWSIKEPYCSPYMLMQESIEINICNALLKMNLKNINTSNIDIYAKLFAACAMTTIKWWIENDQNMSYDYVAKIISDCMERGMNSLLFS